MDSKVKKSKVKSQKSKIKITKLILAFLFGFSLLVTYDCKLSTVNATANGDTPKLNTKPQWKYIVIHHSATKRGNAVMFANYHSARGMQNGLAYHFVIDNGTCGKYDGQLEIGSRWKKQLPGGHCRQQWVNECGIGICLVGNFNRARPTPRQMRTLVNLVHKLMQKYNIPINHVLGHGKIKGEKSQCPGKYFPWKDFYSDLKGKE